MISDVDSTSRIRNVPIAHYECCCWKIKNRNSVSLNAVRPKFKRESQVSKAFQVFERLMRRCIRGLSTDINDSRAVKLKAFQLAYVIVVDDEVHNYMRGLQIEILNKYGVNHGLKASPHITLKLGFPASTVEPFGLYFDRLISEVRPFEVCLKGISSFEEGIIFLDVEKSIQLEGLRRRILHDLSAEFDVQPYGIEGDAFHFHATLAYGLSREDFTEACQVLKGENVEFRFMFDTLALFRHTGDEWVTYKRAKLGSA